MTHNNANDKPFVVAEDLTSAMDQMHDAAMSRDEVRACEGRLGKKVVNLMVAWIEDEAARRTPPHAVLMAAMSGGISMLFTAIASLDLPAGVRGAIADDLREGFLSQYDRCAAQLRAIEETAPCP